METENNVIISIIVPVYNVEQYLERCINSLRNQTLKSIEIIAINDGSTDNSGKILDSIAQSDSRIRVIHKENGGVSSARNVGIDNATGRYIAFVDPDDYISADMYEHMVKACESGNYDMIQCNYRIVYDDGTEKIHVDIPDSTLIGSKELLMGFMNDVIIPSCAVKLLKRSVLGELRFKQGLPVAEDKLLTAQFLDRAQSAKTLSKVCYFYYQRKNSVTYEELNDKHFADIDVFSEIAKSNKTTGTISDIVVKCHLAEKSLSLIQRIVQTGTHYEKFNKLRRLIISNLKMVFTTPKFSYKDRASVILICVCPWFFKWIYKKYITYRLRKE